VLCLTYGHCLQIHVRIRSNVHERPIPAALFLQLLPRLASASRPLSLSRTSAVFATRTSQGGATVTSDIVELELLSGTLHVRGVASVT